MPKVKPDPKRPFEVTTADLNRLASAVDLLLATRFTGKLNRHQRVQVAPVRRLRAELRDAIKEREQT
jgi:hypothetical protein